MKADTSSDRHIETDAMTHAQVNGITEDVSGYSADKVKVRYKGNAT
jgi:hypothetical protein